MQCLLSFVNRLMNARYMFAPPEVGGGNEHSGRVRKGGRNENRVTGNMAWGEFIHLTARPIAGVPDPHLHAHGFVFNTTVDEQEQAWKAGQFRDLKRDAPYFE